MATSINKVILVGNVGKDPDIRYVDKETPVATFPLATSERGFTTNDGKQVPERTEWHNIVVWRGLAKVVEKFARKGSLVLIEGKLRTRNWKDQSGATHYITEVVADELEVLSGRKEYSAEGQAPTQQIF